MKIVKFLSLALLAGVLATSSVFAEETVKSASVKIAESNLKAQIVKLVSQESFDGNGVVYLKFKVSADKGLEVLNVKSENSDLASLVQKAVSQNSVSVSSSLQGVYEIAIRFVQPEDAGHYYAVR